MNRREPRTDGRVEETGTAIATHCLMALDCSGPEAPAAFYADSAGHPFCLCRT
ncbi:hypothetical protein [Streptomyces sp. MBT27]|uniref:hypothetical protein n=1 Tax=Streptomyces sp. MBT27 TaxID=1488356 RepID=UPI00141E8060|nr:hypothetical protein [Streptomyces sp. MBT27]